MKRILASLLCLGLLAVAMPAKQAAAEGIYVAPKIIWGITQMSGSKMNFAVDHPINGPMSGSDRMGSKTDNTFGGSLAIGYDFSKSHGIPVRAELEYAIFSGAKVKKSESYFEAADDWGRDKKEQTFGIQTLFLNAYFDFDTGTQFTPYVGAGLGLAFINTKGKFRGSGDDSGDEQDFGRYEFNLSTKSRTVTNFAWNIGAGVGYEIDKNWTVDLGYRFVGLGSVKTKNSTGSFNADLDSFAGGPYAFDFNGQARTKNLYQHQIALGIRYTF